MSPCLYLLLGITDRYQGRRRSLREPSGMSFGRAEFSGGTLGEGKRPSVVLSAAAELDDPPVEG